MAERRPLVVASGVVRELPSGDTLTGTALKVFTASSSSLTNGSSVTVTHDADANFRRDISACTDISREAGGGTTALLLNCNGTDGSTTITDSSLNALTGTRGGTTCEIDTAQSKYGGASLLLSSGRIDFDNAALAMGTGDGAIEGWLRFSSTAGTQIVFDARTSDSDGAGLLFYASAGTPIVLIGGAGITGGSALSAGVWYHWAITRSGTSLRLFIDGTQSGSTHTLSGGLNISRTKYRFGGDYSVGGNPLNGWLDDVRISTGTARYTSTFTSPASQLAVSSYTVRTPLRISNAHVGDSGSIWVEEGNGSGSDLTTKTTFTNQTGKTLTNFMGVVGINPLKVAG